MNSRVLLQTALVVNLLLLAACQQTPVQPPPPVVIPPPSCECPVVETAKVEPAPVAPTKVVEYLPCPAAPVAPAPSVVKPVQIEDLLVIGRVENILLEQHKVLIKARIDSGTSLSSMNALDLKQFERDGKSWVRFALLNPDTKEKMFFERPVRRTVKIKQMDKQLQRRPVVSMNVVLGNLEEKMDVTLMDRSDYLYQVVIGRDFLRDRVLVDVSRKFVTRPAQK